MEIIKQSRREKLREATHEEIKRVAQQQMAEQGAAGLSLRAIAAEMGMSTPALYNYYASRDALVTALIVDAYTSLAEMIEAEADKYPEAEYGARFLAATLAYREWAVANPTLYALIFGTPIPGYKAPQEITVPAAIRSTATFIIILAQAWNAGKVRIPEGYTQLPEKLEQHLKIWAESIGMDISTSLLAYGLSGWGVIQGLVTLELFNHLQPTTGDPAELYLLQAKAYLHQLGLEV
ncbi:TetR/AcrR family transcriptional regulator [Candidatus Chlorohelix sp.]|uniref:TetR/AcrR family transcriptional regulator n=1 Tax=Candidatus Chlorohelix sp. TaxID=3139201 RepID=UPI0030216EE6